MPGDCYPYAPPCPIGDVRHEWLKTPEGKWLSWQHINFIRDAHTGDLYFIGTDNDDELLYQGDDWARLYKLDVDKLGESLEISNAISYVAEKHVKLNSPWKGDFDAGGGSYVSPSGQLIL